MLTPLTINHSAEDIFFCSDMHLHQGAPFLYKDRGYSSESEHDNGLVHKWNERCGERSIVFHLGDFVFRDPDGALFEAFIGRLSFKTLYLLLGNHVSGHKQVYRRHLNEQLSKIGLTGAPFEVYPLIWDLGGERSVVFLPQYAEILANKEAVVLSHYPVESWNGMAAAASLMIHGHSHNHLKRKIARRRDVGIECYGGPVSLRQLLTEMKDEKPEIVDHHGENTTTNTT